ncbi:MAG TPA: hypothetical protein VGL84_03215 [Gaiellaceae bacterium]
MGRRVLAAGGTALLAAWAISVTGVTGLGASVNWSLLGAGVALLALRAALLPRGE